MKWQIPKNYYEEFRLDELIIHKKMTKHLLKMMIKRNDTEKTVKKIIIHFENHDVSSQDFIDDSEIPKPKEMGFLEFINYLENDFYYDSFIIWTINYIYLYYYESDCDYIRLCVIPKSDNVDFFDPLR